TQPPAPPPPAPRAAAPRGGERCGEASGEGRYRGDWFTGTAAIEGWSLRCRRETGGVPMTARCEKTLALEELRKGDRVRIEFPATVDVEGRITPSHAVRGRVIRVRRAMVLLETPYCELVELQVGCEVTIWPMNCLRASSTSDATITDVTSESSPAGMARTLPR
ncbi:MAG: hypothetical protein Q4C47_03955, partial [Planctomycetia bacterium]|nr:hypothetical protein [Planctomycetia bacterium]